MSVGSMMSSLGVGMRVAATNTIAVSRVLFTITAKITQLAFVKAVTMLMPTGGGALLFSSSVRAIVYSAANLAFHRACIGTLVAGLSDYVNRATLLPAQKELYDFASKSLSFTGKLAKDRDDIYKDMFLTAMVLEELMHKEISDIVGWPALKAQQGLIWGHYALVKDAYQIYSHGILTLHELMMQRLTKMYNEAEPKFRQYLEPKLGLNPGEDIEHLYIVPDMTSIVTKGLTLSLYIDDDIRLLRLITEQYDQSNFETSGNDAATLIDRVNEKYGYIVVNGREVH
jgi:hypothetical protein